jgi:hypothetical protein
VGKVIEAYRIGISIVLQGDIAQKVGAFTDQFKVLDRIVQQAQGSLNSMAAAVRGLSRLSSGLATEWQKTAAAMERAAAAASRMNAGGASSGGWQAPPIAPAVSVSPRMPLLLTGPSSGGTGGGGGIPLYPIGGGGGTGGGGGGMFSGMAPIADIAATVTAVRGSMREDIAIRQALLSMGYKAGTPEFEAAIGQLRGVAAQGTAGTIYTESRAAQAMPGAAGVLGFGGDTSKSRAEALRKFSAIFPTAVQFGEVAEMQGMGSLDQAVTAAIAFAHMTDRYEPKQLESGLDRLLNIARLTHETVGGEAGILKYSVPVGQAAGMKADDVAALTGFLQVVGFSGTTAGTGLGQLIMGLKPSSLQRMDTGHSKAMVAMGLMDKDGKIAKDVAPGGKLDAMALLKHIADYAGKNKPLEVLETLRNAFTVRGMRVAGVLENEDTIGRLKNYLDQLNRLPGASATQKALAQSPMQQFEQVMARLSDVGNTLATATLPGLKVAFEVLQTSLASFNKFLQDNQPVAAGLGYAAEGGAAYLAYRGLRGAASRLAGPRVAAAVGAAARGPAGLAAAIAAALWSYDAGWLSHHYWSPTDPFAVTDDHGNRSTPWGGGGAGKGGSWTDGLLKGITDAVSTVAHAEGSRPVNVTIMMDGRVIANAVGKSMGSSISAPSSSPTVGDMRLVPPQPGEVWSP